MSNFELDTSCETLVTDSNPWQTVALPQLAEAFTPPVPPEIPKPKEALVEQAELVIGIDRSKLSELRLSPRLEHLRETFQKLPERLEFRPGVNLIFGPNGSGKTTFTRAIHYAIEAHDRYQDRILEGDSEEDAINFANAVFELPKNRGSHFEDYLMAGAAPQIASCINIERYANNTYPRYCNAQEEVGRQLQLQREMASQHSFRELGSFFEFDGPAHSSDKLLEDASQNLSARQTVDRDIETFLDVSFTMRRWNTDHSTEVEFPDWEIPEEFSKMSRGRALGRLGLQRKRDYYPGITFVDEPETGLDVQRHINLPESIQTWYPKGSIMVVPTNSTELFRSNLPRINFITPEKGIYIPE
ncbi:AAA family ATPase [Candidatus Saccharibacteria bacterium]|nr:AAA family ATPase [Candidatus Saccharibacteria bacterium]